MGVPKRKRSRARRDSRFANKGIKVKAITSCKNCSSPLVTHAACVSCGFYKGIKVMHTKAERAVKRGQAKQAKTARQQPGESAPAEKE
jgi:large subunit ribosomal protein L32